MSALENSTMTPVRHEISKFNDSEERERQRSQRRRLKQIKKTIIVKREKPYLLFGCCGCGTQLEEVEVELPNFLDILEQQRVKEMILSYLEFEEIVDLRCICYRASELIESPPIPPNDSKPDFKTLLSQNPVIEDYINADVINKLWMNDVFGGSVFNPIKRARTGIGGKMEMTHFSAEKIKKVQKPNSLIDKIEAMSPLNKLYEMK